VLYSAGSLVDRYGRRCLAWCGLATQTLSGSVTIRSSTAGNSPLTVPLTLVVASFGTRSTSGSIVIPQVAEGQAGPENWKTTIVLVSGSTATAAFTLRFWQADGAPVAMPVTGSGNVTGVSGSIAPGGFQIIETPGGTEPLVSGWAEVVSQSRLNGYVVFRSRIGSVDSEGVVPIPSPGLRRLLLPFDNTAEFVTSAAIANADTDLPADVTVRFLGEDGQLIGGGNLRLGPRTRDAFGFPSRFPVTVGRRGIAEFNSGVDLFALGLRFNPNSSFTSLEPVDPGRDTRRLRRIVPQVVDGGPDAARWKTTAVVVNNDAVEASLTMRFLRLDGSPLLLPIAGSGIVSEVRRTIAVGGSTVIETEGTSPALVDGWAEIVSDQSLSGTVVFRSRGPDKDSEGAVPIPSVGGRRLVLPFDNQQGFGTSAAMANPDNLPTMVTARFYDENGLLFSTSVLPVGLRSREAFEFSRQFPETTGRRGVVEFTSSNADVFVIGLRFNPRRSFTSLTPAEP